MAESQIVAILKEAEAGMPIKDVCRNTTLATRRFINDERSMAVWKRQALNDLKSWKKKTVA